MCGFNMNHPQKNTMMPPVSADTEKTWSTDTEKEALVWLQLLASEEVKAWDIKGFQRWLQQAPAHRTVFNEVKRRWDAAHLADDHVQVLLRKYVQESPQSQFPRMGRRAWLGTAISAAAVAGVGVVYPPLGLWPGLDTWGADERTAPGEQRVLALGDSASVILNTRTSVRRQAVDGDMTGFELIDGEAAIDLKDHTHSLVITAGVGRSLATSGRFEVRYLHGKACVTCLDGTVRVEHPAGSHLLNANQQTIYDAAALSSVTTVHVAQMSAWRQGDILFNQTKLADAVEEINRYRSGRVILMNDAVRAKTVNGRFEIASLDFALIQLQHAFDLHARSLPGNVLILS
jgi:transmembrane sensor